MMECFNNDDAILITDLHLNGKKFHEYDAIVEAVKSAKVPIIFMGDIFSAKYHKGWKKYPELYRAVCGQIVYFLKGNNDPDWEFEWVYFTKYKVKVCHGHALPDLLCRIVNLFKSGKERPKPNLHKQFELVEKAKKRFLGENVIIGHFHFEYIHPEIGLVILEPRKVYHLKDLVNI